ncbi:MAG: DUF2807 domain-containing protein [Clostridia bacterium]|nr:DUF2807 domain-containing protein [Clostridia bacterium]MDE7328774.1 DUF2807 domain-containing protein [Clostridia bacterium]
MKKHIIITVVLLVIGIAMCAVGGVICGAGDGFAFKRDLEYTEHTFEAESDIKAIDFELKGNYNFIIQSGESCSLKYSESEISDISVVESNGALKVVEKTHWTNFIQSWFAKTQKTDLVLTVIEGTVLTMDCEFDGAVTMELPAWEYGNINFDVNGAAQIKTAGEIKTEDVEFDVSGYGELSMSGEFKDVEVATSGGSNVSLQGSATSLKISASGSSAFKSEDLKCDNVSIKASGSVEANIKGEGGTLTARMSGSCRIYAAEFTLSTAEIRVSGSVRADVNVSDKIIVNASGSAKINYYGDPQIEKTVSGGVKINKIG